MSNDPEIVARLDALAWMPRRPTRAVAKPLAPRVGRGRTVADNPTLEELRTRFPTIVKTHPAWGGKNLHVEIATEMRRLYIAHHANLLGVSESQIKLSNSLGYRPPGYEIKHGNADNMVRYLEHATFTVEAVPRPGGFAAGLCGCGKPLDGTDRTYCKTCKTAHNRAEKQRRLAATPTAPSQRARRVVTAPEHAPKPAGHNHRQVIDPAPTAIAERPQTKVVIDNGRRIVIIDFRVSTNRVFPLTEPRLLELAGKVRSGFNSIDGGRLNDACGETTDVAYAADTPHGVVLWITEANAAVGWASALARRALRLSADIGELIAPTRPRAVNYARDNFIAAATVIAACTDMTYLADSYQMSVEADRELSPAELVSVDKLIAADAIRPTNDDGWSIARMTLRNESNLHDRIPYSITAGALNERRTAA